MKKMLLATAATAMFGLAIIAAAPQTAHAAQTSATVVLKPQSASALEDAVYNVTDPTSSQFHHYLTPAQVADQFGRSQSDINKMKTYFGKYHLKLSVYHGRLMVRVKGEEKNLAKAFHAKRVGKGTKARTQVNLPQAVRSQVAAVVGLEVGSTGKTKAKVNTHVTPSGDTPNLSLSQSAFSKRYGSAKFANRYHLNSLYHSGLTGSGQHVGLISLSDVNLADVSTYLQKDGQSADTSRITKHYIGSPKTIRHNMRSDAGMLLQIEATLDVQQAAAVAPGANVDLYVGASNSRYTTPDASFLNTFAYAIADNRAKQLSTSFSVGNERFGIKPGISETPDQYNAAFNLLFQQAALQGITVFNASGDNGPYDEASPKQNLSIPTSPYEVEVGGTTLPFQRISAGKLITVENERAWGNSYHLTPTEIKKGAFQGSGGGFSLLNKTTPRYQLGVPGVNTFSALQHVAYKRGRRVLVANPKRIDGVGHGRNVPDIAGNADPDTGYASYVSMPTTKSRKHARSMWMVMGGTSFTSPQMAAASAVLNSGLGQPAGFWNPQIYRFAQTADSPFTPMTSPLNNDNLYYTGQPGTLYNQATGLGTVNFEKLLTRFKAEA